MDYRKIEFGKADAIEEGIDFPNLLIDGYLDNQGVINKALNQSIFLFLGYKGSGKSALAQHLELAQQKHGLIVKNILLKDFPYNNFKKIVTGSIESEVKLPVAWDWLLLIHIIDLIYENEPNQGILPNELHSTIKALQQSGFLPIGNLRDFVTKSSKKSFKINIQSIFEFAFDAHSDISETDLQFFHIVDFLKKLVSQISTSIKYVIVIDGLDEILTSKEIQYQSLAALIDGVKDINRFFKQNRIDVKTIILCRTDLFEKLPHPNKNKIRQDSSFNFNWYDNSKNPQKSNLVELSNVRGRIVYPELEDLFESFFPKHYENRTIYSDLLDYTRHTPRDFLQLLKHIQGFCQGNTVQASDIQNGIKSYSSNYFLPEIKDELVGYLAFSKVDDLIRLLSMLRKRDFLLREAVELAEKQNSFEAKELEEIFGDLFECSAIGHIYRSEMDRNRFSFKYRNRSASFNPSERIILHKGVWKALDLT